MPTQSADMKSQRYTAVIPQDEGWWIGWAEIPGVNSQGKTRAERLKNQRAALREATDLNREETGNGYEKALLSV